MLQLLIYLICNSYIQTASLHSYEFISLFSRTPEAYVIIN